MRKLNIQADGSTNSNNMTTYPLILNNNTGVFRIEVKNKTAVGGIVCAYTIFSYIKIYFSVKNNDGIFNYEICRINSSSSEIEYSSEILNNIFNITFIDKSEYKYDIHIIADHINTIDINPIKKSCKNK